MTHGSADWGTRSRSGRVTMLRATVQGFVFLFTACIVATAGQLRFTNTPLDTAALPRLDTTQLRQKAFLSDSITIVVQFARPVQPDDLEALTQVGATVHHYLPDYAYLVTMPIDSVEQIASVANLEWVGLLPDYAKLGRDIARMRVNTPSAKADSTKVRYIVLSVDERAAKELEGRGYRIASIRKTAMGWYDIRLEASLAKSDELSSLDSVFRVESVPEYELHGERAAQTAAGNLNTAGTAPSGPGYTDWLASEGLSGGNGVIVQVQDDGLDKGVATNQPWTAHVDILGQIAGIFNATSDPTGDSKAGHGEINAGIIMGNATLGMTDAAGFRLGQGMAPQASVYATKIFKNSGPFDIGNMTFTDLARFAQNAGARFSNNSWGAPVDGEYNADCAEFDALTRDCDPLEEGDQPMVYFFSAGNEGPANGTVGSPGSAKNVITVGAEENSDADGTDGCSVRPSSSNSNRDIVNFSSRGPTMDGRFGVTVVAVGTHVQGPASIATGYDGSGVCDKYWPSGQTNYARSSGTSHSCPIACGAGIIVHELFTKQLSGAGAPPNPSPAMVRAVLTNTATDLAGGNDGGGGSITPVPNPQQGWGAVNLRTLMSFKNALYISDQERTFTASNQTFEILLGRVDPSKPIKITLAWTDAPGVPGTVSLVNDLDLEVEDNGTLYRGNVFSNGFSVPGGNADRRNTLEAVYLNNPGTGALVVRVKAFNIAGNGVPNTGGPLDQDFALFSTNATTQSHKGFLNISPSLVSCGGTLTLNVSDSDLKGARSTVVGLSTTDGDFETLTLEETGADTGIFTGTIGSASGTPVEDGVLQISDGAVVTAVYIDADIGNGQPSPIEDTATVDCSTPQIVNVQVTDLYSSQAAITFQTNEPAASAVFYGPSCAALAQTGQGLGQVMQHRIDIAGLLPSTLYSFVVDAIDPAGNESIAPDGGCLNFTTPERPDYFTELFSDSSNDVDRQTLTFTPNGSASFYSVCRAPALLFPTDPNGGSVLSLGDDAFVTVTLAGGKRVSLYGTSYSSFFVGSNGNISFQTGSTDFTETLDLHFAQPRISALFDDLVPSQQNPVRFQQMSDRAVVTWVNVPEFGTVNANSFQVELFFDGTIRITHLDIAAEDGLVGLSKGGGVPPDFVESDMSAYGQCNQSFTLSGTITEIGGGGLPGVTLAGLPGPPVTDANGLYTVTVPSGFSGTATPQKSGYAFSPTHRTYTNVTAHFVDQDYAASQGQLTVSPAVQNVDAGGGGTDFNVQNAGSGTLNWSATVIAGSSWATITSGASGTNTGTIHVSFQPNNTPSQRTAKVRVTAPGTFGSPADVTLVQAAGPDLGITPLTRNVAYTAGTTSFSIANTGAGTLNWNAQIVSGNDWLGIASGLNGTNSGVINVSFAKNAGAQRVGTIRVTSNGVQTPQLDVTIVQAAAPDLVVAPIQRSLASGAGQTTFAVSVNGGTGIRWSAKVASGDWLSITSETEGTDAGQIEVSYGSNSAMSPRSATILFSSNDTKNSPVEVSLVQAGFAKLVVLAPNGGEIIKRGNKAKIRWETQGQLDGKVRIELLRNGIIKRTIKRDLINDGAANWLVPTDLDKGRGYQVRIVSESNGAIADLSDDTFRLK